jgi:hypothetical protein
VCPRTWGSSLFVITLTRHGLARVSVHALLAHQALLLLPGHAPRVTLLSWVSTRLGPRLALVSRVSGLALGPCPGHWRVARWAPRTISTISWRVLTSTWAPAVLVLLAVTLGHLLSCMLEVLRVTPGLEVLPLTTQQLQLTRGPPGSTGTTAAVHLVAARPEGPEVAEAIQACQLLAEKICEVFHPIELSRKDAI